MIKTNEHNVSFNDLTVDTAGLQALTHAGIKTATETEVMQTAGIPAQETEGANVVLATEIIADLKKQLEEAKEEADNLEKDWEFCSQQRLILTMQTDIINFALKIFDYKCLSMALSYVKAAYNQQPPEEDGQEGEE